MGYSFIDYKGKREQFHDYKVAFVMGVLLRKYNQLIQSNYSYHRLDDLMEWWGNIASHPGPGCYRLKLNEYISSEDKEQLILSLIDGVITDFYTEPDIFAPDYINSLTLIETVEYRDKVPKQYFSDILKRFRSIIDPGV